MGPRGGCRRRTFHVKIALLSAASFLLLALAAPPAAADVEAPVPYCEWNHDVMRDQYVSYNGLTWFVVGVRFLDGSPLCQVHVVCYGEWFECRIPPLP